MRSNHVVDLFHVLFVPVGVGHVLADIERVPEPTEPEITAERAPPQHALQVPAQVEMVQAAHAAHQPQQIRKRLALVVVGGCLTASFVHARARSANRRTNVVHNTRVCSA